MSTVGILAVTLALAPATTAFAEGPIIEGPIVNIGELIHFEPDEIVDFSQVQFIVQLAEGIIDAPQPDD